MILKAALEYAERGWAVFPTHSILNGRCTCGKANCDSPGKHPIDKGGFQNASSDPATIREMFARQHPVNVAIATGEKSGIFVLDIDVGPNKVGWAAFQELEAENGEIDKPMMVRTGSGGFHIYRPTLGRVVKCSASQLATGIDVRGDGGYVIAPPSRHLSGSTYSWISFTSDLSGEPDWLLDLVTAPSKPKHTRVPSKPKRTRVPAFKEGSRNTHLASKAGSLVRNGVCGNDLEQVLLAYNAEQENPVSESEALGVARSISRYEKEELLELDELSLSRAFGQKITGRLCHTDSYGWMGNPPILSGVHP